MKRLKQLFAATVLIAVLAFAYSGDAAHGVALTMGVGLVATMKTKGVTLTDEQERFLNELDNGFEAKSAESFADIKRQVDEYNLKLKAADDRIKEISVKADEADNRAKALDKAMGEMKVSGRMSLKSFEGEIEEKLEKNAEKLKAGQKFDLEFQRKAVGDMASATNLSGQVVLPQVQGGVILRPYEDLHMRNILPVGTTNSPVVRHIRDNGGEGAPGMVAEGGTKPQMDRDLTVEDANVRKIATYLRVPEEMIEDIPYLIGFLTNIGTQEVLKVEDAQILYGDGTGQNLSGLFTNATAFAAGTSVVAAPNEFDVLRAARKQMRNAQRYPTFAMVSPDDFFVMSSRKDANNNYILQGGGNGILPNINGLPIIENSSVASGDFLVGDRIAAEIDFRKSLVIRFFDQDRDNVIKNMVTILIEERLALPIYYTNGFVKGTFSAAITDLTS